MPTLRAPHPRLLAALLLAGCVRAPAAPAAGDAPAPSAAPARRWEVSLAPGSAGYRVESSASIELAGDTAVARDTVRSVAVFRYRLTSAPAGLLVAGVIDSFAVTAGRTGTTERPLGGPVSFEALVDTAARRVRLLGAFGDTAAARDCAVPARAVVVAARDLLVPLPRSLEAGQRWTDTVTTVTCRGEVPIVTRSVQRYEVEGADEREGTAAVRIRRTSVTTLEGSASPRGQAVTITGDGRGDTRLWIDPRTGRLLGASGEATTTLTLEAAGQSRTFTQRAAQRVSPLAP